MSENESGTEALHPSLMDQLSLSAPIDEKRLALIRATYINLAFAVTAAVIGAEVGSTMDWLSSMMEQWYGAVAALLALNVLPAIAHAFRKHPTLGFAGLVTDGLISGLILGPLVRALSDSVLGQNILMQAILLTVLAFASVTYMVFVLQQTYSASRLLLNSLAIAALAGCVLGLFCSSTLLQILTTILIGALGIVGLVSGTSQVLQDETIDEPISGALMLFAAIFNIFIACVRLLAILNDDD